MLTVPKWIEGLADLPVVTESTEVSKIVIIGRQGLVARHPRYPRIKETKPRSEHIHSIKWRLGGSAI
jgi:hypothetical protein